MAVGHSILIIIYQMLKTGQPYQEKGATYFDERDQQRVQCRLVARLERMGYQVTLRPQAEGPDSLCQTEQVEERTSCRETFCAVRVRFSKELC